MVLCGILLLVPTLTWATPSDDPDVMKHRGNPIGGQGKEKPVITLTKPEGGWTTSFQLDISGTCSDPTCDPIVININGVPLLHSLFPGCIFEKVSRGQRQK